MCDRSGRERISLLHDVLQLLSELAEYPCETAWERYEVMGLLWRTKAALKEHGWRDVDVSYEGALEPDESSLGPGTRGPSTSQRA